MFKLLFGLNTNNCDTPSIISKINIWFFINIRIFKLKASNILSYFILSLNNLKIKKLNIYYKNLTFENIYIYGIYIFSILASVLCIITLV